MRDRTFDLQEKKELKKKLDSYRLMSQALLGRSAYSTNFDDLVIRIVDHLHVLLEDLKAFQHLPEPIKGSLNVESAAEIIEKYGYESVEDLNDENWKEAEKVAFVNGKIILRMCIRAISTAKVEIDALPTTKKATSIPEAQSNSTTQKEAKEELDKVEIDEERTRTIGGWLGLPQHKVTPREEKIFIYGMVIGFFLGAGFILSIASFVWLMISS